MMINGYDVMLNVQNMIDSENYDVKVKWRQNRESTFQGKEVNVEHKLSEKS